MADLEEQAEGGDKPDLADLSSKIGGLPDALQKGLGQMFLQMEQDRAAKAEADRRAADAAALASKKTATEAEQIAKFDELSPEDKVALLRSVLGADAMKLLEPQLAELKKTGEQLTYDVTASKMHQRIEQVKADPQVEFWAELKEEILAVAKNNPGVDPADAYWMAYGRNAEKVAGLKKEKQAKETEQTDLSRRFGGLSQDIISTVGKKNLSARDAAEVAWSKAFG